MRPVGKTARDALPFSFSSSEHAKPAAGVASSGAAATQDADDDSDSNAPGNLKDLKMVGERFVFDLQDGSKLSLVTRAGAALVLTPVLTAAPLLSV